MRAIGFLALVLLFAACRTTSKGWAGKDYHVLHESDDLQIRASYAFVEPDGEHVFLRWAGARSKPGAPWIEEFMLVIFDDRDGDGLAGPGEILASRSSRERTTKVLVSSVRVEIRGRVEDIKGHATVRTASLRDGGVWRLIVD